MYDEIKLNKLIENTLNICNSENYPKVCGMLQDSYGRKKVFTRVKDLVLNLGMDNVLTAIIQVENELSY